MQAQPTIGGQTGNAPEPVMLIEPGQPPTGQDALSDHDEDEDDLTLRDDDGGEP